MHDDFLDKKELELGESGNAKRQNVCILTLIRRATESISPWSA
jgi:hypothetical protein